MPQSLSLDNFADAFLSARTMEPQYLDVGYEYPLPFRAVPRHGSNSLIVAFHGAVNRKQRSYPSFGRLYGGIARRAHQIAFADPTLALDESVSLAWFAGSQALPLQKALVPVIERLQQELGISRLIFVGGSGGGFAALYYSWHFPNSIAIAASPQTVIKNYGMARLEQYLKTAWPSGIDNETHPPTLDLRDLYKSSMSNTVVYLQSQGDYRHLFDHMVPFLNSISSDFRKRVVATVSYWGKPGHSGTVPSSEVLRWIKSALSVDIPTGEQLRDEFYRSSTHVSDRNQEINGRGSVQDKKDLASQINMAEHFRLTERLANETLQRKDVYCGE